MKKILFTLTLLATFTAAKAQKTDTLQGLRADTLVFMAVQQPPQFPGGIDKFYYYLSGAIHYPAVSAEKHVQGRVFLSFIIEKDGTISHVKVARGVAEDIDAEAARVMKLSPKWNPGMQNGKPVRVAYTMPISFMLAKG